MKYARLGRSGLKVSRVCLGTNMFGSGYIDEKRVLSVVDAAYEQGINFIDTSDSYQAGRSEQMVGKVVRGRRHEFVIGTKGFAPTGDGVNDRGLSRKHLMDAVDGSLRRLDTDYIDVYLVHFWDPETPLEETLRTLDGLVRQGKIRYLACSNFAAWQLCKALWVSDKHGLERFESVQPEYNLARREIEQELFPFCQDQLVGVTPYQIFMGGMLTGTYKRDSPPPEGTHMRYVQRAKDTYWNETNFDRAERLRTLAAELGCELPQLALAWALANPLITSVIVGASRPEQVASNAKAVDLNVPQEVIEQIDRL